MNLLEPVQCAENRDVPDHEIARKVYYAVWDMAWDHFRSVTITLDEDCGVTSFDKLNLDCYLQKFGETLTKKMERYDNRWSGVMSALIGMTKTNARVPVEVVTLEEVYSKAIQFIGMKIMKYVQSHKLIRLGRDLEPEPFFDVEYGQTPEPCV